MAGHSKWANIKHRKAAQDKKRGKLYTKLIREITVGARMGGGDVNDNPRLRAAVDKALAANMPKDTIDRAIQRGAGDGDGSDVEELTYEGYGQNGVAILVEAMTDNRNRTVAEVRYAFNKFGGNLGTDGSVAYLFNRQGMINFAPGNDEETVMDVALEAGAEDFDVEDDGAISVTTAWESLSGVVAALTEAGLEPDHSEVTMVASTIVDCDEETAAKILRLVDALEELDDVQEVYTNGDFPESAYE
ncbi:MAG: YebC/PmpR family DNA-binding transcriptional regulator [Pseudomonadales bacterium]|nr:YebC/PmpR family DNA-binding transcriptional regulator [Pseudomonadales bacterium]